MTTTLRRNLPSPQPRRRRPSSWWVLTVCEWVIIGAIGVAALSPIAVLVAILSYGVPCLEGPCHTHGYRLTVEVEVDGQVRRDSSVVEVTWALVPGKLEPFWTALLHGEATLVDLGPHGVVIATLSGMGPPEGHGVNASRLALAAHAGTFPHIQLPHGPDTPPDERTLTMLRRTVNRPVELGPGALPQLVWLPNPADCRTARVVTPDALANAIAPGVQLRRITLEVTRNGGTFGLANRLPWLPHLLEHERPGQRSTDRPCGPHAAEAPAAVELHGHALSRTW